MIQVGRELVFKNQGRVIVVFEPHTYSRTKFLIEEFVQSFKSADVVIFAPVYSARENQKEGFDSLKLLNEVKEFGINAFYFESFDEIKNEVLKFSKQNDVVLLLGAGTIEKLAKMF
jgi:UDP-N-acetylmuramate--alanine ligase